MNKLERVLAEINELKDDVHNEDEWNSLSHLEGVVNTLLKEGESLDNAARDYADACELDNDTHFMERQLCIEHFKAGARYDRNKLVEVIQQYSDKGLKMYNKTLVDREEGERSDEFYWDGFSDCADEILKNETINKDRQL